jgi:drug/metabolite transporter (DMT)-like permease
MKERIAIGGLAGVVMAAVGWDAQRFVDPHTVSEFPSWRMLVIVPAVFGAMVWLIARRRTVDGVAPVLIAVAPAVVAASCVYGAMIALVTWQRWTLPPFWLIPASFVMTTIMMMVVGTACAAAVAAFLFRKNRALT